MRLIDADELLKNEFKNDISFNAFQNLVKRQSTIDAVPVMVVLCEKCKYCIKEDDYEHWCDGWGRPMRLVNVNDFCSHGKEQDDALDS